MNEIHSSLERKSSAPTPTPGKTLSVSRLFTKHFTFGGTPTCHPPHRETGPRDPSEILFSARQGKARTYPQMCSHFCLATRSRENLFSLLPASLQPSCLRNPEQLLLSSAHLSKGPTLTAHTQCMTYHYSLATKAIKFSPIMTLARSSQHPLNFRLGHAHCYC